MALLFLALYRGSKLDELWETQNRLTSPSSCIALHLRTKTTHTTTPRRPGRLAVETMGQRAKEEFETGSGKRFWSLPADTKCQYSRTSWKSYELVPEKCNHI